ncbi:MAG: hypothetical protein LBL27_05175 [Coriobacteriales bacterium]|nr:hypothetical protein [Coriobacteriales bacterium]
MSEKRSGSLGLREFGESVVFSHEGGAFLLDVAGRDDVAELARLNLSVKLNMAHFEKLLLSDDATGFAHRGGFFKVMDAEALKRCIDESHSIIFVLRELGDRKDGEGLSGGRIVASFWVSLDDPGFVPPSSSFARYLEKHPVLTGALAQGKVCYGRELIVARDAPKFMSPSMAIFCGAFHTMQKAGFGYALSEVYRLAGYCVGTDVFGADIANEAALHMVAEAKGFRIARNELRTLDFDEGLSVTIEPLAVLFDFAVTLRGLGNWLVEQEVEVQEVQ